MAFLKDFVSVNATQQNLKGFDCGVKPMNNFLVNNASRDMGLGISSTWVLMTSPEGSEEPSVAAYYSFTNQVVSRESIQSFPHSLKKSKKLPIYPEMPVILMARLALDSKFHGTGLADKVLVYAMRHAVKLCDQGIGAVGVVVDAIDERAKRFYMRTEIFHPFTDEPMRLYTPMIAIRKI